MNSPCELISAQVGSLFTCEPINQDIRIQTPFFYPDGDFIALFYVEDRNTATLTDFGETLGWLRMQTIARRRSSWQQQLIADICRLHQIDLKQGTLTLRIERSDDLAGAVMLFSQCILRIADLCFAFKNRAGESIVDEVEDLLQEHSLQFERAPKVQGRSTTIWYLDFQIGRSNRHTLVKVLSAANHTASHSLAVDALAMWHDLSHLTKEQESFRFISLFDDTIDVWNEEDFRLVGDISDIAYWSQSDEFLQKIA